MLRLSALALLFAAPMAAAQTAPAPAPSTPATTPTPAQPATLTPATQTPTTQTTTTANPRLAPGGVVAGGNGFPLHLQATFDTSLGNGILAPGYQIQPQLGTSLNLRPSASLPKIDGLPKMLLNGSIDFSVASWTFSTGGTGVYERQVRVSDPSVALIFPGIFKEEFTGAVLSLVASARAPISITSRQQNLITNFGGAAQVSWSQDVPFGSFFLQYTPSIRGAVYSEVAATMPCDAPQGGLARAGANPVNGVDELPTLIAREGEILPNGECILRGRQPLASVSNSFAGGWSDPSGNHTISLSGGIAHSFLRPMKASPELSSPFASGQNFNESTNGSLNYTYTLPVDFNAFITTGTFSSQPAFAGSNYFRFPFWDFVTPANNFSGVFFDITVGI
jgi:hypothetical protein